MSQHIYTKDGTSVRELALMKWFVRQSYTAPNGTALSDKAVDAWAAEIYRKIPPPLEASKRYK